MKQNLPSNIEIGRAALADYFANWKTVAVLSLIWFVSFFLTFVPFIGKFLMIVSLLFVTNAILESALRPAPLNHLIRNTWRRLPSIVLIAATTWITTIGGFMFLIIPGVILTVLFQFSQPELIAHDRRGLLAVFHSYLLARPYGWTLFFRWQSFWFFIALLSVALILPLSGLSYLARSVTPLFFALALISGITGIMLAVFPMGLGMYYLARLYRLAVAAEKSSQIEDIPLWKKALAVAFYGGLVIVAFTSTAKFLSSLPAYENAYPAPADIKDL